MTRFVLVPKPGGYYDQDGVGEVCGHSCETYFATYGECDCTVYGACRGLSPEADVKYLCDADSHVPGQWWSLRTEVLVVPVNEPLELVP